MRLERFCILAVCLTALTVLSSPSVWAQDKEAAAVALAEAADAVEAARGETAHSEGALTDAEIAGSSKAAHNAWMLTCCALVLFMTAPGLAMFYGGLVRRKKRP